MCCGRVTWTRRGIYARLSIGMDARFPASRGSSTLFVNALFASSRHWSCRCTSTKAWRAPPASEIAAAQDTATNPQVLSAFALAICAGGGSPAFPGMPASQDLASPGMRQRDQESDGRTFEGCAKRRFVRLGKRLFHVIGNALLGQQLPEACGCETQIRSRRPVLRPPWRGQRSLDRRWIYTVEENGILKRTRSSPGAKPSRSARSRKIRAEC